MPFKPKSPQPDLSSLVTTLDNSKIQENNYALYQTIFFLIKNIERSRSLILKDIEELLADLGSITAATFLTVDDESGAFPNSRQVLAGIGITFDDSVPNIRTISGGGGGYAPMSTGAEPLEIMSDGAGSVLMVGFSE